MEVIVETSRGRQFSVEMEPLDTLLELKKKIQRSQGFPIASQILYCSGQMMLQEDGGLAELYGVEDCSLVRLDVEPDPTLPFMLQLYVRFASPPPGRELSLVHDAMTQPILRLRERIAESERIPVGRVALFAEPDGGVELQDDAALYEYGMDDHGMALYLVTRPPRRTKAKVTVVSACGRKTTQVEVKLAESVGDLRRRLERAPAALDFPLPSEYFFVHNNQIPMANDDRTFASYGVKQGDKLEIFRGRFRV